MKKYKIHKDNKKQQKLSAEEIDQYKDFQSLMVKYNDITKPQKLPLYKNKRVFLFLILLALIAYLLSL